MENQARESLERELHSYNFQLQILFGDKYVRKLNPILILIFVYHFKEINMIKNEEKKFCQKIMKVLSFISLFQKYS